MRRQLVTAAGMLLVFTVLTGLAYPLVVTGVAQVAFNDQAEGSLVTDANGETVGSSLLSQEFTGDEYFHPRPSAAGYDGASSGATNYGPTNEQLLVDVEERVAAYRETNGLSGDVEVPVDAVTSSASGLDPHISIANAELQAPRVAEARGLDAEDVMALVDEHTDERAIGILGEPGVNVLDLNLALDEA